MAAQEDSTSRRARSPRAATKPPGFEELAQAITQGVAVVRAGSVVFANAAWARLVGHASARGLAGTPLLHWVARGDQPPVRRLCAAALSPGGAPPPLVCRLQESAPGRGSGGKGGPRAAWVRLEARPLAWEDQPSLLLTASPVPAPEGSSPEAGRTARATAPSTAQALLAGCAAPLAIVAKQRVLACNPAFAHLVGASSPAQVLAQPQWSRYLPARAWQGLLSRATGKGHSGSEELHLPRGSQPERWWRCSVSPILWEGQAALQVSLQDLTAERQARLEQQRAASLLDGLVEALPFGISVKDLQGRYLLANHSLLAFYGLPRAAMLGFRTEELRGTAQQQARVATEMDQEVLRTGRLARREDVPMRDHSGRVSYRTLFKAPLRDEAGRLIGLVGFTADVTERHEAEEALHASQRLLRTVFDTIPHRLAVKDARGRYLAVNLAEQLAQGGAPGTPAPAQPPPPRPRAEAPALAALERHAVTSKTRVHLAMHRSLDSTGRELIQDVTKLPILNEQGQVEAVLTLAQDITQRVHAEEQARQSARLLQTVFDVIPERLYVKDLEGRHVMVNHAHAAFHGMTPQRMAGLHTRDVPALQEGFTERALAEDRAVLSTGNVVEVPELHLPDRQGRPSIWRLIKLPLRDDGGKIVGLVGLAQDITARKQAERELVEKQRLLESAQQVAALGSWIGIPGDPGRVEISPESARMYGITLQGFSGLADDALRHVPPAEREALLAAARECILNDTPVDMEHRVLHPDGTVHWVHQRGQAERNAHGRAQRIIGVAQDITERKRNEEAMRASQRLLETVFSAIPHDVFVKDAHGRLLMVNQAMARTYRMEPEAMAGLTARQLPGANPQAVEFFEETDRQVLQAGRSVETVRLMQRGPGRAPRWFRELKSPLRDGTGQVMGLVGMAEDIHERMRAEEDLSANRRLLRAVFDTIPHAMFVKDQNSVYTLVNDAQGRLFGLKPEQMMGLPTRQLPGVTAETIDSWIGDDQRVMQGGQRVDVTEGGYRYISGRQVWLDAIKMPLRDEQGRVVGIVGMSIDVTERRHAEEELRTNRRLLRAVFDAIPHRLFVKDQHSRFLMVNHAMARQYHMMPQQMVGLSTLQLPGLTSQQAESLIEEDRQVLESGVMLHRPAVPLNNLDGQPAWVSDIKLPLRDEQGQVVGVVGLAEDVTERLQAERDLQTQRRLLQAVFDAVPFWITVRDRNGRLRMVNRRMAADYGKEPEDFADHTIGQDLFMSEEEKTRIEASMQEMRQTQRPVVAPEVPVTLPGNRKLLLRMVQIPLFDANGWFDGSVGLGEDITDRRKAEAALLQTQKLESLGVLAGGIAHDFNNLLVTILGNASLALLKLPGGTPAHEELSQIELAGQRAADLCRQLLSYAGKSRMEMEATNLNALVQEMPQLLKVSLPKGVTVNFNLAPTLPAVSGDPTQIRQVLMNLVINAGEAIGERTGIITISTGVLQADREYLSLAHMEAEPQEGPYVFLEVSDTGVGMSPETLARIFDPFFTTKFTGRGLGLASVLGIIRSHKGGLKVYSEVGVGTSFKMLLPAVDQPEAPPERPAVEGPWRGSGTVLVVDDEASIRSVARRMLVHLGFDVLEAADGQEALDTLRAHRNEVTLAVLDLTMPRMSGAETLRQMRGIRQDLPVILMSGYNEKVALDRLVGRNLGGFLQKPFKLEQLRERMRALLGESTG